PRAGPWRRAPSPRSPTDPSRQPPLPAGVARAFRHSWARDREARLPFFLRVGAAQHHVLEIESGAGLRGVALDAEPGVRRAVDDLLLFRQGGVDVKAPGA